MRLAGISTQSFPIEGYTSQMQIPGHETSGLIQQNELRSQWGLRLDSTGKKLRPTEIYHLRLKPLIDKSLNENEISRTPLYVSRKRYIADTDPQKDCGEIRGSTIINILPNHKEGEQPPPVNIVVYYYNQGSGLTKSNRVPKRKTYDWWVELKIQGGGFVDTDDIKTNIAPKIGYSETLRYEMKEKDEAWNDAFPDITRRSPSGVVNNIYFKTAGGNYGTFWLVVQAKADGKVIIDFEDVVYNHGGGRNLDPTEFGMVKLDYSVWRY